MDSKKFFDEIAQLLAKSHGGVASQMFGKKCIKINGKAGVAYYQDCLVFKLPENERNQALSLPDSKLWDPSGKGRPMKEWVQLSILHKGKFKKLAKIAADYVG